MTGAELALVAYLVVGMGGVLLTVQGTAHKRRPALAESFGLHLGGQLGLFLWPVLAVWELRMTMGNGRPLSDGAQIRVFGLLSLALWIVILAMIEWMALA